MADVPRFTHPQFEHLTFAAVRYGPEWNGWATPVVTRATLESLLDSLDGQHVFGGFDDNGVAFLRYDEDATVNEPEKVGDYLVPADDGTYDLAPLGWTFEYAPEPDESTEVYLHVGVRLNHAHALTCAVDAVNSTFGTEVSWAYDQTGYADPARVISGWNCWSEPVGEDTNDETTGHVVIPASSHAEAATTFRRLLEAGMGELFVPIADGVDRPRATYAALSEAGDYEHGVGELGITRAPDGSPGIIWTRGDARVREALDADLADLEPANPDETTPVALPDLPPFPAGWPAPQVRFLERAGSIEATVTIPEARVRLGVWQDDDGVTHHAWQSDPENIFIPTTPATYDDLIAGGALVRLTSPDGRAHDGLHVHPDPEVVDAFTEWAGAVRARGAALLAATDQHERYMPATHQRVVRQATGHLEEDPGGAARPTLTSFDHHDVDPAQPALVHDGPQLGL